VTRFGIGLPQVFAGEAIDPGAIRAIARRAEALGFADGWVQESLLSRSPALDGLELLSHVAAVTDRIGLGISVVVLPQHDPVVLAKRMATVDRLSGGRLIAGVGVGAPRASYGPAAGGGTTAERFEEVHGLLEALWRGERVVHRGVRWWADGVAVTPVPRQRPRPPVWFGARSPAALRRAARLGDGWMGAGSSTREDFVRQRATVLAALEAAGRDPAAFTISKRVYIRVDDDERRARQRRDAYLDGLYGPGWPPREVAVAGPAERCAEALDELVAAGAQHLALTPMFDDAEQVEALAALAGLVAR
jgi:alkanesulfonate monooxygenase SsuD/methylene tetrahydromethanopterin reductase-like flavin-dependent oxidoreductase (luciferase family)